MTITTKPTTTKMVTRMRQDARHGPSGGTFSQDIKTAVRLVCNHFDTGLMRIYSFRAADPNMPLVSGKTVTGFANTEEQAQALTDRTSTYNFMA